MANQSWNILLGRIRGLFDHFLSFLGLRFVFSECWTNIHEVSHTLCPFPVFLRTRKPDRSLPLGFDCDAVRSIPLDLAGGLSDPRKGVVNSNGHDPQNEQ